MVDDVGDSEMTTAVPDDGVVHLGVFGLPGYRFHLIHITAFICQVISISISSGVVIYLLKSGSIMKKSIGDRLVFYLSLCDLGFSCSHVMDHLHMEITEDHPPDALCAMFAFFLNQFIQAQAIYVIFSALNAFVMVVKERRINVGQYDWKLHLSAHGIPFLLGIVGTSTGHFGPSGAWCYVDLRKPAGPIISQIVSGFIVAAFLVNVIGYGAVWFKIKQVAATSKAGGSQKKYHGTAKVMMLFVLVYIAQWVFFVVFCMCAFFTFPGMVIMWLAVFLSNIGGFFNFMVYFWIRKRFQNVGNKEKEAGASTVETSNNTTTVTTVSS